MPRIRLLADNARSQASGASGQDHAGNYVFEAGRGELVAVNIDATGWAGADTIASSAWTSEDGATLSSRTLSGRVASCNAYVPGEDPIAEPRAYRITNTLTLGIGPIRKTTFWLKAGTRD